MIAGLTFLSLSIVLQALPQVSPNNRVSRETIFSLPPWPFKLPFHYGSSCARLGYLRDLRSVLSN